MNWIVGILWILLWGAVGYFTVGAICAFIRMKRNEKAMADWAIQHANRWKKITDADGNERMVYNPFDGVL